MNPLSVLTYNCHLNVPFASWKDRNREDAIIDYLIDPTAPQYDIVAIQEEWSKDYVKHFRDKLKDRYPSHFDDFTRHIPDFPSNPSGLILFSSSRVVMDYDTAQYFDMIYEIGPTHFDKQDAFTGKGYFKIDANVDNSQIVTIITTHMPTSASSHRDALKKCFSLLAEACQEAASSNPVILLGDFNINLTKEDTKTGQTFYDEWIGPNGFLGQQNMKDWFQINLPSQPVGYENNSVDGANNACWRHFNKDKVKKEDFDEMRIDYVMTTPELSVAAADIAVCGPNLSYDFGNNSWSTLPNAEWYWEDHGDEPRDCSDHFPVRATITYPSA